MCVKVQSFFGDASTCTKLCSMELPLNSQNVCMEVAPEVICSTELPYNSRNVCMEVAPELNLFAICSDS